MKTKRKRKAIPKHFLGTLLSTGVGLLTSNMAANSANNERARVEKISRKNKYKEELHNDSFEAEQYQDSISNSPTGYYQAKGGKLATPPNSSIKGGNLKPLSSDTVIAKGNTHEQTTIDNTSGIKLLDKGKAFAEIEDDETIKDGVKVYSDRLTVDGKTTYAEASAKLAKEKGKLEEVLNKKDSISNTTNKRKLAILDKKEDLLFEKQEASKINSTNKDKNIPKGKDGMFLDKVFGSLNKGQTREGQIGGAITPFIDNIGNAIITSKTPKIAPPTLERVKNNKTTVNVNPQLAAINEGVSSTAEFIKGNTSNSNVARENIAATRIKGANAKAGILARKENTETQLHNQNQENAQRVLARNNNKIDQNNFKQSLRADDIGKRTSANLANLAGDFIDNRNFNAAKDYQNKELEILSKRGDKSVTNRALNSVGLGVKDRKVAMDLPTTAPIQNTLRPKVQENTRKSQGIKPLANITPTNSLDLPSTKTNLDSSNTKGIQEKLISSGFLGENENDGIIGNKTKKAIKAYQKANGLVVDGIVGKNTLNSLNR